jgi:hypothetical protein
VGADFLLSIAHGWRARVPVPQAQRKDSRERFSQINTECEPSKRREKRREPLSQPVYFIRGGSEDRAKMGNQRIGSQRTEEKRREEKKRKEIRSPPTSTSFAGGRKTGRARMVSLGPNEIPIEMSRGMGNREEIR